MLRKRCNQRKAPDRRFQRPSCKAEEELADRALLWSVPARFPTTPEPTTTSEWDPNRVLTKITKGSLQASRFRINLTVGTFKNATTFQQRKKLCRASSVKCLLICGFWVS